MKQSTSKSSALARGLKVFIVLAVLTVIEYFVGIAELPAILLWILAVTKGGLVLWYFMHLPRVFQPEGAHDEH